MPVMAGGIAASLTLLFSGCPSGDDRCDDNEVLVEAPGRVEYCACAPGSIMASAGYGCTLCGANEEVQGNQCVCKSGYTRLTATGPCEVATGQAIGTACTSDASCSEPYPYCVTDGTDRYCTKQGCTAGACPTGHSCEQASGSSFCAKLPTGVGVVCTATGNECAAFEANFCESFMTNQCFVEGCATGKSKCPGEYGCCDLSALVGTARSLCFAPGQLVNGACPAGTLVTP